ncbi:hypothetical protein [Ralstonia phage Reminis]|uniref:Uncharacterized protein n=1 Tax=Ralstonia phage Reminis TaxID=2662139 RepID=A0A5Q2U8I2_9CAUD|nr:hypothetical protein [Ralstonia phage Reminis]
MPSPGDIAYIEPGVFMYIMDVLREKRVSYDSPQADFIYNEVVKDIRNRIECSIQPK